MSTCTSVDLELGHGIAAELRSIDGEPAGVYYVHPGADGLPCSGYAPIGAPAGWTLERIDPLTISPSLLCRRCGHHGFIRDGQWVPA